MLLALLYMFRPSPVRLFKRPYVLPVIVLALAATCKESWVGCIPAALFMDCVNYPRARVGERLRRLWPFTFLTLVFLIRFIVLGYRGEMMRQALELQSNITLENMRWGIILPFLPFGFLPSDSLLNTVFVVFPLLFMIIPLFLHKKHRLKVILLVLALFGVLFVCAFSSVGNDFYGWLHLPPLMAFAACILALNSQMLIRVIKSVKLGLFCWIALFIGYSYFQSKTVDFLIQEVVIISDSAKNKMNLLRNYSAKLSPGTSLYVPGGLPQHLVNDGLIDKEIKYTLIDLRPNGLYKVYEPYRIAGDANFIFECLKTELKRTNSYRLVIFKEGKLHDVTEEVTRALDTKDTSDIFAKIG